MERKTKIVIFVGIILTLLLVVYMFNYHTGYIADLNYIPLNYTGNLDCNNSYLNYTYKVNSSYAEMNSFFGNNPGFEKIDLYPNYCKNCPDYSSPIAYYYSDENKFWVVSAQGFGIVEDADFYGPFYGKPCINYKRA